MPGKTYLTGKLALQRDNLLIAARKKNITWEMYHKDVAKLEKQQVKINEKLLAKKEAAKVKAAEEKKKEKEAFDKAYEAAKEALRKREEERKKKAEEGKKKREEKKKEKALGFKTVSIGNDWVYCNSATNVYNLYKSFAGKMIEIQATISIESDEETMKKRRKSFHHTIEVGKPRDSWFSVIVAINRANKLRDSETISIFVENTTVSMREVKQVKAVKHKQKFKEGHVNCFLSPVISYLNDVSAGYKTEASKKKIQQIIRRAESLERMYREDGVPEDKIEEICKTLNISVSLYDVLSNKINDYNLGKNWKIAFYNTRFNHVDIGQLCLKDIPEELTEEEMFNKVLSLVKADKWFMTQGKAVYTKETLVTFKNSPSYMIRYNDYPVPALIRTLEGSFKLHDSKASAMEAMDKEIDLWNKSVDAVKYPELSTFLHAGYLVNANPVFFKDQEEAVGHLDMKKAYTQFQHTGKYYKGFMGKVYKWSKLNVGIEFVTKNLGFYKLKCLGFRENESFMNKLGLVYGKEYVMFSPEILCLTDLGMKVQILAGAWGEVFDFKFTPEMVDERSLYREWSGKLGMNNKDNCYTFYDKEAMAENIKADHPNVRVVYTNEQIKVFVPKTRQPTFFHIAGAITSYTRINMLMKMKEIGFQNVVKVMLDGVYTTTPVENDDLFKIKPLKNHHDAGNNWYLDFNEGTENLCMDWPEYDGVCEKYTLLAGAGGCGKTHSILNGPYHDVLYVAPTRMLGLKMNKDKKCQWTTLHKLVGTDADNKKVRSWAEENNRMPSVILIDELTMTTKAMVMNAIEMYPQSMILLAGDIDGKQWYQTKFGDGKIKADIYEPKGWAVKKFVVDYRAKDQQLKDLKVKIRDVMKSVFTDGGRDDADKVMSWLISQVEVVPFAEAISKFKEQKSIWIAPTHEISDRLLKNGVVSGFRVVCPNKVYSKGEVLEEDIGAGCEKRGSLTVHSSQGLTISDRKLFISVYDSFDYSMLYTAISRAVHYNQLVFVGK